MTQRWLKFWRRVFCLHQDMRRFRDTDNRYYRICDHCGVVVPYSVDVEATRRPR